MCEMQKKVPKFLIEIIQKFNETTIKTNFVGLRLISKTNIDGMQLICKTNFGGLQLICILQNGHKFICDLHNFK